MSSHRMSKEEALALGVEAYLFGYPLVLMDITRGVMTATPHVTERNAPVNQFAHSSTFPDPTTTDVVNPNADTLCSTAWLDLSSEPIVLSVPAMGNRYYLMQMLDAWTNMFASPGTRTTGNGKEHFAIVGPGWKGKLPDGLKQIDSPTNMVWIIGSTQTNSKDDYAAVHAIQKQYVLTELSAWGKQQKSPANPKFEMDVDIKTAPVDQVSSMDTVAFFSRLNSLMKRQPPTAADTAALQRFAIVGIGPGLPFDLHNHDRAVAEGLEQSVSAAQATLTGTVQRGIGKDTNGWNIATNLGLYGTDYLLRATVALVILNGTWKMPPVKRAVERMEREAA